MADAHGDSPVEFQGLDLLTIPAHDSYYGSTTSGYALTLP
jgi:hypothetical protein